MLYEWLFPAGGHWNASALAAVALVGYWFGRRSRGSATPLHGALRGELDRATEIANQLATLSRRMEEEMSTHRASLSRFQSQIRRMQSGADEAAWKRFSEYADALATPTMKLATNMSRAFDELRGCQAQLLTFGGTRIDPFTGLQNRRSMDEQLAAQLSLHADGTRRLSLALFSVQLEPGDAAAAEGRLRAIARLLEDCVRDSDFVARYSADEFAVLMPHTPLAGAAVFSHRLLQRAQRDLRCTLWGGSAEAKLEEPADRLLSRAGAALYGARTQAGPCLFQHNGTTARRSSPPGLSVGDHKPASPDDAESAEPFEDGPQRVVDESLQEAICGRVG